MIESVISRYPAECQPTHVESLGNAGGLSGARLWRLQTSQGELCLRRWPSAHPTKHQLAWLHQVLIHAGRQCEFVPVPISPTASELRFVQHAGHLWELARWMPGTADLNANYTPAKLSAALSALAEFHRAVERLDASRGRSRGLAERHEFATRMAGRELDRWRKKLEQLRGRPFHAQCISILKRAAPLIRELPERIAPLLGTEFPLQPCIRDFWHDHVLFSGNAVTGMVDFGAMRVDTVAIDMARLFGSLAGEEQFPFPPGPADWEAYAEIRMLSKQEQHAVAIFQLANVALSGLNWVRWLMFEEKTFDNIEVVHSRITGILRSVERASGGSENRPS